MTDTSHRSSTQAGSRQDGPPTAWTGWVAFGGLMLLMLGTFQILQGVAALFDDGFYAVTSAGLLVDVDYNTWGWVHMTIGVIGILTGAGLLAGNTVARVVGVGIAMLSALVNVAFLAANPVWSTIMIAIDVVVIYAIVVHGRELKAYL
jgi:hypothetical protein